MKASEFAKYVTEMLEAEKETFLNLIEDDKWDEVRDEIEEYVNNSDTD